MSSIIINSYGQDHQHHPLPPAPPSPPYHAPSNDFFALPFSCPTISHYIDVMEYLDGKKFKRSNQYIITYFGKVCLKKGGTENI